MDRLGVKELHLFTPPLPIPHSGYDQPSRFPLLQMLTFVLAMNLLIALLCWYGVRQIWRVKQRLALLADNLSLAEQRSAELLRQTPQALQQGQQSVQQWHSQVQQVQAQIQQVRQILALLGVGRLVWQQAGQQVGRSRSGPAAGSSGRTFEKPRSKRRGLNFGKFSGKF